jgi:hypothetical protein
MIKIADGTERYITYCRYPFDISKIEVNLRSRINKPTNTLWGSPVDAEYGWRDWCESNEFEWTFDYPVTWGFKEGTKILTIDIVDVENPDKSMLKKYIESRPDWIYEELSFYKIKDDGFSAVQLLDPCVGHCFINDLELMFNSWDCESIAVLDMDTVIIH